MESSDTCEGEMWEHIKNGTRMMRDEEGSIKVRHEDEKQCEGSRIENEVHCEAAESLN